MSDGDVCKHTDNIIKSISAPITKINDLKSKAKQAGQEAIAATGKKTQWIKKRAQNVKEFYQRIGSGLNAGTAPSKRPDLVFFRNILLFLASLVIVYYTLPYVSGKVQTGFSKEQFDKAVKLPESAFNIEEVAEVNQKIKAFEDHKAYFNDGGPYAPANAGVHEVGKTAVALPMLIFFMQFILPPLAIGYIVWFVITYWPYVYRALWGWFLAMYDYFTSLVQGKMGCKWYIRYVTGWKCRSVNFSTYIIQWRRRYIDGPVHQERIKYINQYYAAKERYLTKPYKKYISDPIERRKINAEYAKRIAADRTMEVLLKKARDSSRKVNTGILGTIFQGTVFGQFFNRMLARFRSSKEELLDGYESQTVTGNTCRCPSTSEKTANALNKGVEFIQSRIPEFQSKTAKGKRNCETANQLITEKASIMGSIIVVILALLISLYFYTWKFGTPVFVKNIISHTTVWGANRLKSKRLTVLPYIVVAATLGILAHTGFAN